VRWRECSFAFPQEDQHFVNCVAGLEEPLETGEDGKATLEIIFAAYESAGTGRKVALPFAPPEGLKPIEL
jgi:myo-inositol 2-dehydrogenase / D-chiro-inositol 1-dehydrogenase